MDNRVSSVIQKGHAYDASHFLGNSDGVYMLQSLTQAKMMVSPQTDSRLATFRYQNASFLIGATWRSKYNNYYLLKPTTKAYCFDD